MAGDTRTNTLIAQSRCFDCLSHPTQLEVQTYIIAYASGLGTDPNTLAGLAKCMTCYSQQTLLEMRTYLLAVIGGQSTDPQDLIAAAKCYDCIPLGFLGAVETYLFSTDPQGPGITNPNDLAQAAKGFARLPPTTLVEIQVYLLSLMSGISFGNCTLAHLTRCMKCVPTAYLRTVGTFLTQVIEDGGGLPPATGCTDVPANLVPVVTAHYSAGSISSLDIFFPEVCCSPKGYWIYGSSNNAQLQQGLIPGATGGMPYTVLGVDVSGIADTVGYYVKQECASGSFSDPSNTVTFFDGTPTASEWADRVQANGGARPSNATINAVSTFVASMMGAGIWSKMKHINVVAPDSAIAFKTPLVVGTGGNDPLQEVSSPTLSLTVNGASSTASGAYLTGLNLNTLFSSDTDVGISFYVHTDSSNNRGIFGNGLTGPGSGLLVWYRHTTNNTGITCYSIAVLSAAAARQLGYQSFNRSANNALRFFRASSTEAHHQVVLDSSVNAVARPNTSNNPFMAYSLDGAVAGVFDGRCSYFSLHTFLTQAESQSHYNAVQALRAALGGGFV